MAAKVGWLAEPLAQPAKCGCQNSKVAGNMFPAFPRFCNPGEVAAEVVAVEVVVLFVLVIAVMSVQVLLM